MKITVLFPTQTEAELFQRDDVSTIISGVGLSATAHATTRLIHQQKPDMLIMAGIAGAYPHSGLKIGDVTLVASAPFVNTAEVDLENMEGAAFFHTCLQENQAFLELRAISNFVNIQNDEWDMQGSVKAMTAGLHQLIDSLLQSK